MYRDCPERRSSQNTDKLRSVKYTPAIASTLTLKGAAKGHPSRHKVICYLLHEKIWKEVVKNSQKKLQPATIPVMAVNGESSLMWLGGCDITGGRLCWGTQYSCSP